MHLLKNLLSRIILHRILILQIHLIYELWDRCLRNRNWIRIFIKIAKIFYDRCQRYVNLSFQDNLQGFQNNLCCLVLIVIFLWCGQEDSLFLNFVGNKTCRQTSISYQVEILWKNLIQNFSYFQKIKLFSLCNHQKLLQTINILDNHYIKNLQGILPPISSSFLILIHFLFSILPIQF